MLGQNSIIWERIYFSYSCQYCSKKHPDSGCLQIFLNLNYRRSLRHDGLTMATDLASESNRMSSHFFIRFLLYNFTQMALRKNFSRNKAFPFVNYSIIHTVWQELSRHSHKEYISSKQMCNNIRTMAFQKTNIPAQWNIYSI